MLIVHHLRKSQSGGNRRHGRELLAEMAGSYVIGSAARTVFTLEPASPSPEDDRVVFTVAKAELTGNVISTGAAAQVARMKEDLSLGSQLWGGIGKQLAVAVAPNIATASAMTRQWLHDSGGVESTFKNMDIGIAGAVAEVLNLAQRAAALWTVMTEGAKQHELAWTAIKQAGLLAFEGLKNAAADWTREFLRKINEAIKSVETLVNAVKVSFAGVFNALSKSIAESISGTINRALEGASKVSERLGAGPITDRVSITAPVLSPDRTTLPEIPLPEPAGTGRQEEIKAELFATGEAARISGEKMRAAQAEFSNPTWGADYLRNFLKIRAETAKGVEDLRADLDRIGNDAGAAAKAAAAGAANAGKTAAQAIGDSFRALSDRTGLAAGQLGNTLQDIGGRIESFQTEVALSTREMARTAADANRGLAEESVAGILKGTASLGDALTRWSSRILDPLREAPRHLQGPRVNPGLHLLLAGGAGVAAENRLARLFQKVRHEALGHRRPEVCGRHRVTPDTAGGGG